MKIKDIIQILEDFAPTAFAESYDNVGLITGSPDWECKGALATLDCTEEVVLEADALGYNLIIAHHPIVFGGLKKLNGKNYVERAVIQSIKKDIAIYAIHTNLDNIPDGVNLKIANKLGLTQLEILQPKSGNLNKLSVFVPTEHTELLAMALFSAGAGKIGNYDQASFRTAGEGTFRGNNLSSPTYGKAGKYEKVAETKLEVLVPNHLVNNVLAALKANHPYEEVAYDLVSLQNENQSIGSGMIGKLAEPMNFTDFLETIKRSFRLKFLKYTHLEIKQVQKIAICGGAGSFLIHSAKAKGADVYITADVKYHEFFDGDGQMSIVDIGHFESEQYTPEIILDTINKKAVNLPAQKSKVNTNPVCYF